MITFIRTFIWYIFMRNPVEIFAGAAALSMAGVVASAGTSILTGRRREARALTMEGFPLAACFLLFCLADWALLQSLPVFKLSFSPETRPPLIASIVVRLFIFWGLLGAVFLARWRGRSRDATVQTRSAVLLFLVANLGFTAIQVDAYIVEPLWVETTEHTLAFADLDPTAPPVRVVQLTDTHISRSSFREERVIQMVNDLEPDIIVLTGDYLNLSYLTDPVSAAHFRQFASQLDAPYGIYAVRGSVEPTWDSMAWLLEGTGIVWLEQETVTVDVRGQRVTLVGVACSHTWEIDTDRLNQTMAGVPGDAFTLLLYHAPDLIHQAVEHKVDLFLSGHTHGGQLRLPIFGPMATGSSFGKQYVAGLFQEGETWLYNSRGIGFEGGGMPRARFLCRPEIAVFELGGKVD